MSIFDFDEEVHIAKRNLFAVICINQSIEYGAESSVNEMIEQVNKSLKKELDEYEKIHISYVYETAGMTEAIPFFTLKEDTECRYMELPKRNMQHNMNHLFFLSMAMIKNAQESDEKVEGRIFLLTNEKFARVNQIVWEVAGRLEVNPFLNEVFVNFVLYKTPEAGGDLLEQYIRSRAGSKVIEMHNPGFVEIE